MLIYNVTVKMEQEIAEDWLRWILTHHGPGMIATGCFTRFSVLRLLDMEDMEGPTYAVQYFADSMDHYQRYLDEFSDDMSLESFGKWGNRFVAFRTVMEVVK